MSDEINELEKFILCENKDHFIKKLISDTESYYYFTLINALDKYGIDLPKENLQHLKKFRKFKSNKSKSIQLRVLLQQYDKAQNQEEKQKIVNKINRKIFKLKFKHDVPKQFQKQNDHQIRNAIMENAMDDININNNCEQLQLQNQFSNDLQAQQVFSPQQMSPQQMSPQLSPKQQSQEIIQQQCIPRKQSNYSQDSADASHSFDEREEKKLVDDSIEDKQNQDVDDDEDDDDEDIDIKNKDLKGVVRVHPITSTLDQKFISFEEFLPNIYNTPNEFYKLNPQAYTYINSEKLAKNCQDASVLQNFLTKAILSELTPKNLSLLIQKYIKIQVQKNKHFIFDQTQIFTYCTLDQLRYLRKQHSSDLMQIPQFVGELFSKEFLISLNDGTEESEYQQEDVFSIDNQEFQLARLERLKKMFEWAQQLPEKINTLADQILTEILNYGIQINHYDFDLFTVYLKHPLQCPHQFNRRQTKSYKWKPYDSFWHSIHGFNTTAWLEQDELFLQYLMKFYMIKQSKTVQPFDEYFDERYLQKILIHARLYIGDSDIQNVSKYLNEKEIAALHQEKMLRICKNNKQYYKPGEDVCVFLDIQNIPILQVKIFEIVTENYYLNTFQKFDVHINLDGLTANEEKMFDFQNEQKDSQVSDKEGAKDQLQNQHPLKITTREFKFDNITKKDKGIFVIEFFGSGIASRVVIAKGRLSLISRNTIAGFLVTIIDENGVIQVPNEKTDHVGVWLNKKFYACTDKVNGQILLPYNTSESVQNLILVSGDFASYSTVTIPSGQYAFTSNFIFSRESFIMGNQAQVIIQPILKINKEIAPVDIIEEAVITVQTTTEDNIPATTRFDDIHFQNGLDFVCEFPIPAKLKDISIKVNGKVRSICQQGSSSNDNKQNIASSYQLNFQTYKSSNVFAGLFLTGNCIVGYDLNLLGKNGEPKRGIEIQVKLLHNLQNECYECMLITDEKGQIHLGVLKNISTIKAEIKETQDILKVQRSWILDEETQGGVCNLPNSLSICQGETLTIPYVVYSESKKIQQSGQEQQKETPNQMDIKQRFTLIKVFKEFNNGSSYYSQYSQPCRVISNCTDFLKINGSNLTADNLIPGEYLLLVKELFQVIRISVLKGSTRWMKSTSIIQPNQTLFDIKKSPEKVLNSVEFIGAELISSSQQQAETQQDNNQSNKLKLQFKVQDKEEAPFLRVHVLAYQLLPQDKTECVQALCDSSESLRPSRVKLLNTKNSYLQNRQLGSEFAYVLDRKGQTRYTGNSLEKPQILLKRALVRDTTFIQEVHEIQNDGYDDVGIEEIARQASYTDIFVCQAKKMEYKRPKTMKKKKFLKKDNNNQDQYNFHFQSKVARYFDSYDDKVDSMINFLKNPSLVYANLIPVSTQNAKDNNKYVEINDFPVNRFSIIKIIITTGYNHYVYSVPLSQIHPLEKRDLTQKATKARDKYYSIFRNSTVVSKDQTFLIQDITSTEYSVVDSTSKLFDLQIELSKFSGTYNSISGYEGYVEKWGFLKNWDKLSENDKLLKFNEMSSHELHLFTYFKDQKLFKKVILPHLQQKIEKSLIDLFLLEKYQEAVEIYNNLERSIELNWLEQTLLVFMLVSTKKEKEAQKIITAMENQLKLQKQDKERQKRIFDIILNSQEKDTASGKKIMSDKKNVGNVQQQLTRKRSFSDYSNSSEGNNDDSRSVSEIENNSNSEDYYQRQIRNAHGSRGRGRARVINRHTEECECDEDIDIYGEDYGEEQEEYYGEEQESERREGGGGGGGEYHTTKYAFDPFANQFKSQLHNRTYDNYSMQNLEKTKEYCERQYFEQNNEALTPQLVQLSQFWVELCKYIIQNKSFAGFLTASFINATSSHTELIAVLSILSLPSIVPEHKWTTGNGKEQSITAIGDSFLIFTKEIKEGVPKLRADLTVTQRFFDPKNKFAYSDEDPTIFYEKDVEEGDFLCNKVYGCQVIVQNSSVAQQQIQVLYEVPEGSLPVNNIDYTRCQNLVIKAYATEIIEYFFYFPSPSLEFFSIYPSNVSNKDGDIISVAKEKRFQVAVSRTSDKMDTINDILIKGSIDDILNFIETKNIFNSKIFNFSDIYHLLRNKSFFTKVVEIMRNKRVFDYTIFSYSLFHCDHESLRDFFNNQTNRDKFSKYISYIQCSLFKLPMNIGCIGGLNPKLLEYYPLINPRVHLLKKDTANILNKEFKSQYQTFLMYLAEKGQSKLDLLDKLTFIYYLLLQDRVDDALNIYRSITAKDQRQDQTAQIQYDYISAYLDYYNGYPNFKIAREIIEKYLDYQVIGWRNLFYDMANQLAEYDGEEMAEDQLVLELRGLKGDEDEKRKAENAAEKEQILQIKIEGKDIVIEHKNLLRDGQNEVVLHLDFYLIDLEVFFSKNPFLSSISEDFGYLKPSHTEKVTIKKPQAAQQKQDDQQEFLSITKVKVPEKLQKVNVYIQVSSSEKKAGTTYFSTSMKVQIFENLGQLKVMDEFGKPLTKIYVKSFSYNNSAQTMFHKDGYTDLRGRFEYLQLSNMQGPNFIKMALFIMSDDLGSLIKEAKVPSKMGAQQQTVQLLSKKWQDKYSKKCEKTK